jgi:hypothetical protein
MRLTTNRVLGRKIHAAVERWTHAQIRMTVNQYNPRASHMNRRLGHKHNKRQITTGASTNATTELYWFSENRNFAFERLATV